MLFLCSNFSVFSILWENKLVTDVLLVHSVIQSVSQMLDTSTSMPNSLSGEGNNYVYNTYELMEEAILFIPFLYLSFFNFLITFFFLSFIVSFILSFYFFFLFCTVVCVYSLYSFVINVCSFFSLLDWEKDKPNSEKNVKLIRKLRITNKERARSKYMRRKH